MRVLFLIDKVQGVADMSGSHSVSSAGSSTGPRRRSGLKPGAVAAVLHRGDAALPAEVQLLAFEQVRGFLLLSWSADRFFVLGAVCVVFRSGYECVSACHCLCAGCCVSSLRLVA